MRPWRGEGIDEDPNSGDGWSTEREKAEPVPDMAEPLERVSKREAALDGEGEPRRVGMSHGIASDDGEAGRAGMRCCSENVSAVIEAPPERQDRRALKLPGVGRSTTYGVQALVVYATARRRGKLIRCRDDRECGVDEDALPARLLHRSE